MNVVLRPVLEYACPVWHYSLTKQQTRTVEDVQRRAVQIVGNIPYADACEPMGNSSLADRRFDLCSKPFARISNDELHTLFIIYYLLSVTLS